MLMFAQMLRGYNGAFKHNDLLEMSFRLFMSYYTQLSIILQIENGKTLKEIDKNLNKSDSPDLGKFKELQK